ncbi:MAG: membrane protein insertion efficiency factor YidD [Deltaproteobacteria bacterium]|nr:membrane protein insertion efficiency factor YidD [Deltaproteobacteria bacterium]
MPRSCCEPHAAVRATPRPARRTALAVLRLYKLAVSPWLPAACRFEPTCSDYARDCFASHSIPRAFLLTLWRLLRCHPFARGGFDPAPRP